LAVYRLFVSQGKCLIDRHAFNAGVRAFDFESHALQEIYQRLTKAGSGFVLLLAHVGGWQLALPHLRQLSGDRPVSLLMREAETADVRAHVRGDDAGFHVILPDAGPGCVVEMVTRLQRGEIVSIMGDRAYGGQTVEVPFLGAPAHFPASAFAVARAAQCPVVALFVPKTGVTRYRIEPVLFEAPLRENRQSAREGVHAFAEALAAFSQRHPYQCYLFSDIWS
jgi:predicted LPLAT superfamily acyltransferase